MFWLRNKKNNFHTAVTHYYFGPGHHGHLLVFEACAISCACLYVFNTSDLDNHWITKNTKKVLTIKIERSHGQDFMHNDNSNKEIL